MELNRSTVLWTVLCLMAVPLVVVFVYLRRMRLQHQRWTAQSSALDRDSLIRKRTRRFKRGTVATPPRARSRDESPSGGVRHRSSSGSANDAGHVAAAAAAALRSHSGDFGGAMRRLGSSNSLSSSTNLAIVSSSESDAAAMGGVHSASSGATSASLGTVHVGRPPRHLSPAGPRRDLTPVARRSTSSAGLQTMPTFSVVCRVNNSEIDDSVPVTRPLDSLRDLFAWRPGFDEFSVARIPLAHRHCEGSGDRPRVLVCHDMMGGYVQDQHPQGRHGSETFRLYHWQHIDVFVYFSHHLVTIPPPGWTNTAHTHGVRALGTFITEWDDGARICAEAFATMESAERLAAALADVASYYRFDGWLINIENVVSTGAIPHVVHFLRVLSSLMKATAGDSHRLAAAPGTSSGAGGAAAMCANTGGLVIWYDSVVSPTGELKWQDELNDRNAAFFDACDGIFLNYTWKPPKLASSAARAATMGARQKDVYAGIDVFGRGSFGGGGYNSATALAEIARAGLSAAIFAPGWVYETQGLPNYTVNQDRLWNALAPLCPTHGPASLPFVSTFDVGGGERVFVDGHEVWPSPWTNLSNQSCQPTFRAEMFGLPAASGCKASVDTAKAFNGGASFRLVGTRGALTRPQQNSADTGCAARLFSSHLPLSSPVVVTYTYLVEPSANPRTAVDLDVELRLVVAGADGVGPRLIVLGGDDECAGVRGRMSPGFPGATASDLDSSYDTSDADTANYDGGPGALPYRVLPSEDTALDGRLFERYAISRSPRMVPNGPATTAVDVQRDGVWRYGTVFGETRRLLVAAEGAGSDVPREDTALAAARLGNESAAAGVMGRWLTRHYVVASRELRNCRIAEIQFAAIARANTPNGARSDAWDVRLGQVRVAECRSLLGRRRAVSEIRCTDVDIRRCGEPPELKLSVSLSWQTPSLALHQVDPATGETIPASANAASVSGATPLGWAEGFAYFDIYDYTRRKFVGRSFANSFRATNIPMPATGQDGQLVFAVRPVTLSHWKVPLDDAPRVRLQWSYSED